MAVSNEQQSFVIGSKHKEKPKYKNTKKNTRIKKKNQKIKQKERKTERKKKRKIFSKCSAHLNAVVVLCLCNRQQRNQLHRQQRYCNHLFFTFQRNNRRVPSHSLCLLVRKRKARAHSTDTTNKTKLDKQCKVCQKRSNLRCFFLHFFFFSFFSISLFFLLADVLFCRMLRLLRLQLNASLISCLTRTKHFCLARIKR